MSFESLINISPCAFHRRKIIEVKIIDDEEYEKNKSFTIELGEPILLEIGQKHGGCPCVSMQCGSKNEKMESDLEHFAHLLRLEKSDGHFKWESELLMMEKTFQWSCFRKWVFTPLNVH